MVKLGVVPVAGRAAPVRQMAFVLNSAAASITLVDVRTQKELPRIPALREPHP